MKLNFITIKFIILINYLLIIFIVIKSNNKNNNLKTKFYNKFNFINELIKNYENLYTYSRDNILKPNYLGYKLNYYPNKKIKGICICVVGKEENLYAKEFVEYYISLKIDKIFIIDNNEINGEYFDDVLKQYISNKFVEIINARGISSIQMPIYNYIYKKYSYSYDWIIFIDFDEYIYIRKNNNMNDYLYNKRFEKCEVILLNWIIYDDNDLIEYDKRTLINRFKRQKLNSNRGKSIIRGGLKDILIPTSMNPGINVKYFCNSNGTRIFPINYFERKFDKNNLAFIKHFYTKTSKEFCNKILKGDIHYTKDNLLYKKIIKSKIKIFFLINKKTKEKENIINKCIIY